MSEDKAIGIKAWLSGPKPPEPKTPNLQALDKHRIAVLPMSNVSADPNDEYFADGMTDEMILTVSKIEGLEVISRTSIMQYKKNSKPAKEVGQALGVGALLEGSVRKAGNRLRVTVQLIDTLKDKHLWSNSYNREMQDVFGIQTDIAESVAGALKLQLLGEKRAEIKRRNPENIEAYSLYLKGRFYLNERIPESVKKAMHYFEAAIAKDSKFALPYVGLADCYVILVDQVIMDRKELARARSLIDTALKIDGRIAEAHASLALLLDTDWNWAAAKAEHIKSIELDSNYATAHHWYSIHLSFTGNPEESLAEARIAQRLDPFSPIVNQNLGNTLAESGQIDAGIEQLKKTAALEPGFAIVHNFLGQLFVSLSRFHEGIEEFRLCDKILGGFYWSKALLGYTYALTGERAKALEYLADLERASETGYLPDPLLGVVHFALSDKEKAFSLLNNGLRDKSMVMPYIKTMSIFKEIRADPRFMNLLNKIATA